MSRNVSATALMGLEALEAETCGQPAAKLPQRREELPAPGALADLERARPRPLDLDLLLYDDLIVDNAEITVPHPRLHERAFVLVPLAEIAGDVVPGTYHEIELRTGAPSDSAAADLLGTIQNEFPNWPDNASMLVVGSFTHTDGDPVPFRVYFDARIEVEQEFDQDPLVVQEGGNLTVTVTVDPMRWFTNRDGTVDDLSAHDYDTTGEVVPFWANAGEGCRIERE